MGGSQWDDNRDNGALSGLGTVRGPLRDRPCRPAQPKSCPRASSRPSGVFGWPDSGSPSSRSAIPYDGRRTRWAAGALPVADPVATLGLTGMPRRNAAASAASNADRPSQHRRRDSRGLNLLEVNVAPPIGCHDFTQGPTPLTAVLPENFRWPSVPGVRVN